MKKAYGIFETLTEARIVVGDLLERGYDKDQITVISKDNLDCDLEKDSEEKDQNIWEKIKEAFVFDRYHGKYWEEGLEECNREEVLQYKEDLEKGYTVVLIDDRFGEKDQPTIEEGDIRSDLDSDRFK